MYTSYREIPEHEAEICFYQIYCDCMKLFNKWSNVKYTCKHFLQMLQYNIQYVSMAYYICTECTVKKNHIKNENFL